VLPDFFVFGSDEDAPAPAAPPEQMFGEKTIGQCVFRTGWGPGDTVVFCKAGDYFDNHGHFDQGHFTIWRKGWLAVDSGVYDSTSSRHHKEYAIRSVAHNVMLFGDDATGGQRTMSSQDSQDLADHEAKKKSRKLETADLVAWKVDKDWAYVAADLTAAYDGGVVKLWTRELVWLKRGAVVVFDRARASTPGRWLLHTVSEPAAQGAAFRVDEKESSLAGAVLLPKKARVSKVGPGCIVDGRDIAPEKAGEFGVPGAWRIEVESNGMTLVVLAPLEKGQAAPAAKLVEEAAGVGVEVLGKRVMFRKDGPRAVTIQ
jgi:heparin/heparan-sulfate lyase